MTTLNTGKTAQLLSVFCAGIIAVCFLLPWVSWAGQKVAAKDMATARFYEISQERFGLASPFPGFDAANSIFWLIPLLAGVSVAFVLLKKKYARAWGGLAAAMVLSLATVYLLFTNELTVFDATIKLPAALEPAFYVSVAAAVVLILSSWQKNLWLKLLFLTAPVAVSFIAFSQIKEKELTQKVDATSGLKAAYSLPAMDIIQQFVASDSTANAMYREKVIEVYGTISEVNAKDATATLSMADSTGSYVIFDFEKEQVGRVKLLKAGDSVSVKGVCSGSIYSEIMGTQTISVKQTILNK